MPHHSSRGPFHDEPPEEFDKMRDMLGPTGKFPQGKLGPHDEGEFRYRIGIVDGKVVVDFGKPVHSIGLDRSTARELAKFLLTKAAQVP